MSKSFYIFDGSCVSSIYDFKSGTHIFIKPKISYDAFTTLLVLYATVPCNFYVGIENESLNFAFINEFPIFNQNETLFDVAATRSLLYVTDGTRSCGRKLMH